MWAQGISVLYGRAHWRHLANIVEQLCAAAMSGCATKGGDAVCFQITLGNLIQITCLWIYRHISYYMVHVHHSQYNASVWSVCV